MFKSFDENDFFKFFEEWPCSETTHSADALGKGRYQKNEI